ncbi:tyrosine-type recombinase/integrase [Phyllobacterium phragmitis]|uniref:tyrosine-type recombinase/integrase n=1 Tax=Phyllobacterium phragmitis TaxID=2670329 RepID=UPI001304D834|nr:site-specific integrase [Phyllobacterium phragmitis]
MLDNYGNRKYLSSSERTRFFLAASKKSKKVELFCRILLETGCRISEALNLTLYKIDLEEGVVIIRSLKKRNKICHRVIPISPDTMRLFKALMDEVAPEDYDERIWGWTRMTGYRHVCAVMDLAGIKGSQASPKGLRHGFAVAALEAGAPMNLVQRWLGHTHWSTTAIYADVIGPEERGFAERLWLSAEAPRPVMRPSLRGKAGSKKVDQRENPCQKKRVLVAARLAR